MQNLLREGRILIEGDDAQKLTGRKSLNQGVEDLECFQMSIPTRLQHLKTEPAVVETDVNACALDFEVSGRI